MPPTIRAGCLVAGALLVAGVASSLVRTVLLPPPTPTRVVRWSLRLATVCAGAVAGRLSPRAGGRLMAGCAPGSLVLLLAWWTLALNAGLRLLAVGAGAPVAVVPAVLATAPVVALFLAYVAQLAAAHRHRERLVAAIGGVRDAESLLALTRGDRLDGVLSAGLTWLAGLRRAERTHPALAYLRPASALHWLDVAVLLLDAAALVEAVTPRRGSGPARPLLRTGIEYLQGLCRDMGLMIVVPLVSLHGREETRFADTLFRVRATGLRGEPDNRCIWAAFQRSRRQYAPFAMAIELHLLVLRPTGRDRSRAAQPIH